MTPTAIISADWHLTESNPVCRTDDYWETQWEKISFIRELQNEHEIPILLAGDLFDKWKVSPRLESYAIWNLPQDIIAIPGQHDLKNHSLKLINETSFNVLNASGNINSESLNLTSYKWQHHGIIRKCYDNTPQIPLFYYIHTYPYGVPIKPLDGDPRQQKVARNIALGHQFTYIGRTWPGNTASNARKLLRSLPGYDLVILGDNHKTFVVEEDGRMLVNPGSLMRMTADQTDHKPCVFLYFAEDNHVEPVYLPIEKGVISRDHLIKKEEKDKRIQAFVERVRNKKNLGLNFRENLETYFRDNKTDKQIEELVWKSLEEI
jgi:DNA repair exonuclease SbcCD nuclease subunit